LHLTFARTYGNIGAENRKHSFRLADNERITAIEARVDSKHDHGVLRQLEPVREKVEFGEALVVLSPALLLRRRADVES
jgi:hypothetical protein